MNNANREKDEALISLTISSISKVDRLMQCLDKNPAVQKPISKLSEIIK